MVDMNPGYDTLAPSFRARRVVCIGSSTTQGTVGITNRGWSEELRLLMQARWGKGGIGLVQCFREGWSFTTAGDAWTEETNGGVSDCGSTTGAARSAAVATAIATYTVGAAPNGGVANDGFYLYFVDKAGSGTPSYSVDAGAWTNVPGLTFTSSNTVLRSALIAGAYSTTVRVRAGNAAGANQQVTLHGIEPVDLVGTDVGGAVVDNFGHNADFLDSAARAGGGPLLKTLQAVNPDVVIVMFTNDLLFWPGSGPPEGQFWTDNLQTVHDAAETAGANFFPIVYFARGDVDTADELADQDDLRARTRAFATTNSLPLVDLRDDYANFSLADAAAMFADQVHPSHTGCQHIANRVWKFLARTGAETFVRV